MRATSSGHPRSRQANDSGILLETKPDLAECWNASREWQSITVWDDDLELSVLQPPRR
jgi:hypothetical protein